MGLKSVVLSMAGRFYTEVLPSIFRRTPQQVDQANRDIRKDALRKTEKHRTERNEASREGISSGTKTRRKPCSHEAPLLVAASSSSSLIAAMPGTTYRMP